MFPSGALMPRKSKVVRLSIRLAKTLWGEITHISLRSLEELIEAHGLGSLPEPTHSSRDSKKLSAQPANGNYGGPKVRDRRCQIIRQHQLDPNMVKAYATDFCGAKTLREATREQVENFVAHLADWAEKDRNALLCQLNSYLGSKEGAA
jgi:hypothetical protein